MLATWPIAKSPTYSSARTRTSKVAPASTLVARRLGPREEIDERTGEIVPLGTNAYWEGTTPGFVEACATWMKSFQARRPEFAPER